MLCSLSKTVCPQYVSLSRKLSGQPGNMIVKLPATGFALSREVRAAGRGVGGWGERAGVTWNSYRTGNSEGWGLDYVPL